MNANLSPHDAQHFTDVYGSPLYVYNARVLRDRSAQLQHVIAGGELLYSLKANPNVEVAQTLRATGCKVEVASGGELSLALQAGFTPAEVIYIGPGKTSEEIERASQIGIHRFVVDNLDELEILSRQPGVENIVVRVNPDFEATGGKLTMSGRKPKQFGIDRPLVADFVRRARQLGLDVTGLHYYLGTRFLNAADIVENTHRIIDDAKSIVAECELSLDLLDLGGGFGVPYFDGERSLDLQLLAAGLQQGIRSAKREFPGARVLFESGRFLTADAGHLILRVLATKTSYGTKFCVCDGGTNLNMAAVGTGSLGKRNFPSQLVPVEHCDKSDGPITVTGPLCTPDDTVLKGVEWSEEPRAGDLIVLARVGAYGPSASPHSFLGHEYPGELLYNSEATDVPVLADAMAVNNAGG